MTEAPGVVLALLLAVIINNPVSAQSQQPAPARLRIGKGNNNADNADKP